MSRPLSDAALRRLQMIAEVPDLSQTKYEIIRRLGQGGMAVVFLAYDRDLNREIALKVIGTFSSGADPCARLVREATILARLEHPGVVPVHDVGRLPDGRPFYAMKFVRGRQLDAHIRDQPSGQERMRIFERLCEVVAFAHASHVIHRDLKPGNVMVGPFGEVLVMDWGIASIDATHEQPGVVAGTPGYMSPEQERGEPADERSDVYALGAILLFLMPPPNSRALTAIAARAMATTASARYSSVLELAADVARFNAALPVDAYRESIADRMSRIFRKYSTPIALVLAYLLMRVLLLAFGR